MFQTARRPARPQAPPRPRAPYSSPHFAVYCPVDAWSPAINAYALADRLEVCVDLAGVERESIDLRVEPTRLTIQGVRQPPEPPHDPQQRVQILALEIDHGPFERTIVLPRAVATDKVSAEQRNGMLWVRLPFASAR
jgi:HSP20 family molecular chaperone IbpA